jgi:hypothetical protein
LRKRIRVEKQADALAGRELSLLVDLLDLVSAAAKFKLAFEKQVFVGEGPKTGFVL